MNVQAHLRHLRAVLRAHDLRGAVMYLNSLTRHRFTSLYRFDDAMLRNVVFFDRQNPEALSCDDLPVLASYCVFVRDGSCTFRVDDSQSDDRLGLHSKRPEVRAYCGVPLMDEDGRMFGTICHFDTVPRALEDEHVALMEALAPWLPGYARGTEGVSKDEQGAPKNAAFSARLSANET